MQEKNPSSPTGPGRKPLDVDDQTVGVTLRMTTTQRAKLKLLGGAKWMRLQIDKARTPK